jgi:hypothetical protein
MKILLPPIRLQSLAELSAVAVRRVTGFDPFGPNGVGPRAR